MRVCLQIPLEEIDRAKSLGAKWDWKKRIWYASHGEKALLDRWGAAKELIGEDRTFGGSQLFIDLIPKSCWLTNVRSSVHRADWDKVRRFIYKRADYQCECCQAEERLEAHERWHYDEKTKVQKLMRIIALCSACHESTHMGLASIKGRGEIAFKHLMHVTGMDIASAEKHEHDAFMLWEERNAFDWGLDLSIITDSEIRLVRRFTKAERREIVEDAFKSKSGAESGSPIKFKVVERPSALSGSMDEWISARMEGHRPESGKSEKEMEPEPDDPSGSSISL